MSKGTKAADLRDLSADDLRQRVAELERSLFSFRIQKAMGQLEASDKLKVARRDLARMKTVLKEKGA